jgi:hypothetical protein
LKAGSKDNFVVVYLAAQTAVAMAEHLAAQMVASMVE